MFITNRNTIIGEIYQPPTSNMKTFNIELERLLVEIKKERKYAFIMGDFNVNTIIVNINSKLVQDCMNMFSSNYYHKLMNLFAAG